MDPSRRLLRKRSRRGGARLASALPSVALLLVLFGGWQLYVSVKHVNEVILPSPWEVMRSLATNKDLLATNLLVTGEEIVLGFVIGALAGIVLGVLITYSKVLERALFPLVIASQVIPIFAIAPLLIIWFGFGITPKVLIAALIVFFPICVNQVEGLRSADEGAVHLIRSYGASEVRVFWMVRLPTSVPFVLAGMQIGVTFSVIGAVIAEWVGAQKGLGALMLSAASLSNTQVVFAAIVTVAVVGIVLFTLVRVVGDLLFPWQAKSTKS
ncbi:MAG: binding-protein-dependent transport system inner rane component [Acidimicrobiaceae bacterium]|nr:binding-protein-dependent transport system inner rane component [Acidimicrobiaceae bacterium]